MLKTDVTLS